MRTLFKGGGKRHLQNGGSLRGLLKLPILAKSTWVWCVMCVEIYIYIHTYFYVCIYVRADAAEIGSGWFG